MDAPDDTGTRIIKRIEELLRSSTLPPEAVLNMLRRANARPECDPLEEFDRLQHVGRKED